jgi:hypothetical protein
MDNDERNGLLEGHKINTIDVSGRWWTVCPQFRKQQALGSNPTAGSPDFKRLCVEGIDPLLEEKLL